jgi:acetylornithine deacetylase/succinyl-diaminopimelate desuccinylase-like protein
LKGRRSGKCQSKTFVENNTENYDVILISDTGMISNQQPSITTGLRGLSYVEVEVTGPNRDLHSGLYGGAVANQSIFWQNDRFAS